MPLEIFFARATGRLQLRDRLRALAAGAGAAATVLLALRAGGASSLWRAGAAAIIFGAVAGSTYYLTRRLRTTRHAAAAVERADPSLRNLLITAEQLTGAETAIRSCMRDRVMAEASRRAATVDLGRTLPVARDAGILIGATLLLALASSLRLPVSAMTPRQSTGLPSAQPVTEGFSLELTPPAYSARPATRLVNPAAVDVLAGTRAVIHLEGRLPRVRLNDAQLAVQNGTAQAILTQSGYLAIESGTLNRLVPLSVTPDSAPLVRITAPAKDLRVPSTAIAIPIAVEATDDLGLQTLDLRYTIVSGTGEQFSFIEGTLPSAIERASDRSWRLKAELSLARLKLEPGDALIYRAVAVDRRPGEAGLASSDTFFIEVAGPGDVPLEGVEMPPDKERYALSQAMIVLKIERLQAREKSLDRAALTEATGNIAAEQRAVRANFIFLLGGEVEDEQVEAETSHEISEGRFANDARREIVNATVLMGRVEKALAAVSTREALPLARGAVKALQRAFGHSRYLLRALPSRARIDPARRLSGDISSALDWSRSLQPPAPDPATEAARGALVDLKEATVSLETLATPQTPDRTAARGVLQAQLAAIAERLLATAAADLQSAGRDVVVARDAVGAGRTDAARAAMIRAAGPIVAHAQRGRVDAAARGRDAARLAGAAAIAPPLRVPGGRH